MVNHDVVPSSSVARAPGNMPPLPSSVLPFPPFLPLLTPLTSFEAGSHMEPSLTSHSNLLPQPPHLSHFSGLSLLPLQGIGRKVMERQGWAEGQGLGSRCSGVPEALDGDGQHPRCRRGLG